MKLYKAHKGLVRQITSQATVASLDGAMSIPVTAMWDTGATRTFINDGIAKRLRLKTADTLPITHIDGTIMLPVYSAAIEFQGGLILREFRVAAFPASHSFDMIIGMDIISKGRFCVENRTGNTVFTFAC